MREYYERRARDFDQAYLRPGFVGRKRAAYESELAALTEVLRGLRPMRTLDVACGTGFLTQHLRGDVHALDQSPSMLRIAERRVPRATFHAADALALPFPNDVFGRVFTSHFYGHLEEDDRVRFLAEARRVGRELVVVDSAYHEGVERAAWEERRLADGSTHLVYKRFFTPDELRDELGGGVVLLAGHWFVAVRAR